MIQFAHYYERIGGFFSFKIFKDLTLVPYESGGYGFGLTAALNLGTTCSQPIHLITKVQ